MFKIYAIVETEELDMPIEEMLRKRISVLCMNDTMYKKSVLDSIERKNYLLN